MKEICSEGYKLLRWFCTQEQFVPYVSLSRSESFRIEFQAFFSSLSTFPVLILISN